MPLPALTEKQHVSLALGAGLGLFAGGFAVLSRMFKPKEEKQDDGLSASLSTMHIPPCRANAVVVDEEKERRISILEKQLEENKQTIIRLQKEISEHKEDAGALKLHVEAVRSEKQKLEQHRSGLKSENTQLSAKVESLEEQCRALQETEKESRTHRRSLEKELRKVKAHNETLSEKIRRTQDETSDHVTSVSDLKRDVSNLLDDFESNASEMAHLEDACTALQDAVKELEENADGLQNQVRELQMQLERKEATDKEREDMEKQLALARANLSSAESEIARKKNDLLIQQTELRKTREMAAKRARAMAVQIASLVQQLDKLESTCIELTSKEKVTMEKIEALQRELAQTKRNHSNLEVKMNEAFENQGRHLQSATARHQASVRDNQSLLSENASLLEENALLRASLEEHQRRTKKAQEEVRQSIKTTSGPVTVESLHEDVDEHVSSLSKVREEVNQLIERSMKASADDLQKSENLCGSLQKKVDGLVSNSLALEARIEELEKKIRKATDQEKEALKDQLASTQLELDETRESLEKNKLNLMMEKSKLQKMKEYSASIQSALTSKMSDLTLQIEVLEGKYLVAMTRPPSHAIEINTDLSYMRDYTLNLDIALEFDQKGNPKTPKVPTPRRLEEQEPAAAEPKKVTPSPLRKSGSTPSSAKKSTPSRRRVSNSLPKEKLARLKRSESSDDGKPRWK